MDEGRVVLPPAPLPPAGADAVITDALRFFMAENAAAGAADVLNALADADMVIMRGGARAVLRDAELFRLRARMIEIMGGILAVPDGIPNLELLEALADRIGYLHTTASRCHARHVVAEQAAGDAGPAITHAADELHRRARAGKLLIELLADGPPADPIRRLRYYEAAHLMFRKWFDEGFPAGTDTDVLAAYRGDDGAGS